MAWNEPGGNSNNQDPWGGKRRNNGDRKGPPDLDEAFRKLQESLNGLFGGGKKRGSLRKASGSRQTDFDPEMSEWGNPAIIRWLPYTEYIGVRGEPGELKHLSTLRKRNQPRFP